MLGNNDCSVDTYVYKQTFSQYFLNAKYQSYKKNTFGIVTEVKPRQSILFFFY